eukprot:scaffold526562_cov35-Prasinocladus_malaysianus.AAC.1
MTDRAVCSGICRSMLAHSTQEGRTAAYAALAGDMLSTKLVKDGAPGVALLESALAAERTEVGWVATPSPRVIEQLVLGLLHVTGRLSARPPGTQVQPLTPSGPSSSEVDDVNYQPADDVELGILSSTLACLEWVVCKDKLFNMPPHQ